MSDTQTRHDAIVAAGKPVVLLILAWFGSWTIGEIKDLAGIVSALAVGGYAALQAHVLWRDKLRRPPNAPNTGDAQ